MNILGDFINRVNALYPAEIDNEELNSLLTTIRNQGDEIEMKDKEITRLKARLEKLEPAVKEPKAKKAAAKKPAAKKTTAKKA
jgi:alpha-amylase